jgi:hypothetical protein
MKLSYGVCDYVDLSGSLLGSCRQLTMGLRVEKYIRTEYRWSVVSTIVDIKGSECRQNQAYEGASG